MKQLQSRWGGFSTIYCNIFPDCGHWMQHRDAGIFKNFLREERCPYPVLVLFKQHPRCRKQFFYYL
jgi:hypothetical protein